MTSPAPRGAHFLFLLASSRRDGNAETLARHAAAALPGGTRQTWRRLDEHPLPPFADLRHASAEAWQPAIDGHARTLLEATLAATDLVFVAPVYWYSLPASAKLYLDHWTAWLRAPGWDFKARMAGKSLWAVTALSDSDLRYAAPLEGALKLTAAYLDMRWAGLLAGEGNRPGDVTRDTRALTAAKTFFRSADPGSRADG
ncbi:MAG: flavodoxin [Opitutus sp.]|nr:flavodoxin [Opitutus sp.]